MVGPGDFFRTFWTRPNIFKEMLVLGRVGETDHTGPFVWEFFKTLGLCEDALCPYACPHAEVLRLSSTVVGMGSGKFFHGGFYFSS